MRVSSQSAKPTMADVARQAGVSVATVSRVISGTAPVSDEVTRRVWAAAEQLRYEINHVAKSLRQGATHTVAVIVGDLGNPFYADFIKGVELAAQRTEFSVMVCAAPTEEEGAQRQVRMLLSKRVDGVIMWGWCLASDHVERLLGAGTHVLGIELQPERPAGTRALSVDFHTGMRDVVAHLLSLGHRNIAYLWDPGDRPASLESRFFCFREAISQHGLQLSDERIATAIGGQRPEVGQSAVLDLLRRASDVTAVVCHNDLLAFGALQAARQAGFPVPEALSVVGVDDIFTARFTDPPLTTLAIPRQEAGSLAFQELLRQEVARPPIPPAVIPRLIVRASTAPVTLARAAAVS